LQQNFENRVQENLKLLRGKRTRRDVFLTKTFVRNDYSCLLPLFFFLLLFLLLLSLSLFTEREKKRVVVVGKKYRRRERWHYLSLTCKRVSVNLVLCGTKPKRQRLFFLSLFFSPSSLPSRRGGGGIERGT